MTTATSPHNHVRGGYSLGRYIAMDFWRNLRNIGNSFFVIVLPTALFLFFGASMDWSGEPVGVGNVSAWTMIAIASYGAAMATTSMAGSAALEIQQGWGRQLALTAMPHGAFIVAKAAIAVATAALPVLVLNLAGIFTVADMPPGVWLATVGLTIAGSLPFAFYGLAVGLSFRSDAAVGAATGLLVIFSFLGNAFTPLDGVLLDIGRFTPMYGIVALARYPLTGGDLVSMGGTSGSDPLWMVLTNVAAWTVVFAVACLLLQRRRTTRH
ncbi:ABC-2 type transport system permease protein [Prauserella sediminis]|uniref:ABC-2 type transport system permease protein n=1 Tax=Prauserella sediminis TaxID=577680 RepID=A0A839XPG1_9PSEU|nr:ABC transporter permease [Prauserella sediminis]MBB3664631.1 ABC-2 type transport system permease protein [Prauserella sediminis]